MTSHLPGWIFRLTFLSLLGAAAGGLAAEVRWTAADSPYVIGTDWTVPAGTTLVVEAGTEVRFAADVRLIVQGRLLAEGTAEAPILMTHTDADVLWGGIQFQDSQEDNRLRHCRLEYGQSLDGQVGVVNSRLWLDHVTFDHSKLRRVRTIDSSLRVENCLFLDMFAPDEPPLTDNNSEHVWGHGIPDDGVFLLRNNVFGKVKGHNDAVDFDGPARPHPIIQIRDNLFLGGGDDAMDLEGDAHVEGNVVMHFVKDSHNHASGEANGLSAGNGRHYVLVRNVFAHCQHVAQVKDESFLTFVNNTVVDVSGAAIYFDLDLPGRGPGRGAWIENSIFADTPDLFAGVTAETDLTIHHSLLPAAWHVYGEGNYDADPLFVAPDQNDFTLQADSIARATGSWGLDMGAHVPSGAAITGEPAGRSPLPTATLRVGGPGITAYQVSLNDPNGPWGPVRDVNEPLELTDLPTGTVITVTIRGRDSAGAWQTTPTVSRSWTVEPGAWSLRIDEFMAFNQSAVEHEGTYPDWIELLYTGAGPLDLTGFSLTDDPTNTRKAVLPAGTLIHPGERLVLWADDDDATTGLHLGFALNADGESLALFDPWGRLLDQVDFGRQLPDVSVARHGPDGRWRLAWPSPGEPTRPAPLADRRNVVLNEWLARAVVVRPDGYVECANLATDPVRLDGLALTDDLGGLGHTVTWGPLSFLAGHGFCLVETGTDPAGADLVLDLSGGTLALLDTGGAVIDQIDYGPQTPDISEGRDGDGSDLIVPQALPTPGLPNPGGGPVVTEPIVLLDVTSPKAVWIPSDETVFATDWRSDPLYDDSTWLQSEGEPGGVGYEAGSGYGQRISLDVIAMRQQVTSCYVRSVFDVNAEDLAALSSLALHIAYDDGFVATLNGVEIARRNAPTSPAWDASATSNHEAGSAGFDLTADLSDRLDLLVPGRNVLAIHGLNVNLNSSDFLILTRLDGTVSRALPGRDYTSAQSLLGQLRVTELMYHAENGSDEDYVELTNVGSEILDVNGVRWTRGIDYTFGPLLLAPGQAVVVAADPNQLRQVYGATVPVVGPYRGKLSNSGERLTLTLPAPLDVAILDFTYDDAWVPATDGDGQSLTIRDPMATPQTWRLPDAWTAAPPTPGS